MRFFVHFQFIMSFGYYKFVHSYIFESVLKIKTFVTRYSKSPTQLTFFYFIALMIALFDIFYYTIYFDGMHSNSVNISNAASIFSYSSILKIYIFRILYWRSYSFRHSILTSEQLSMTTMWYVSFLYCDISETFYTCHYTWINFKSL